MGQVILQDHRRDRRGHRQVQLQELLEIGRVIGQNTQFAEIIPRQEITRIGGQLQGDRLACDVERLDVLDILSGVAHITDAQTRI